VGPVVPREVVRTYVNGHANLFEIGANEIDVARATRDFQTRHNGVRHVTLQQQIAGIDLFGCEIRANLTGRGQLINISSTMLPRPAGDFQPLAATVSALDAIRIAAANIGVAITVDPEPLENPSGPELRQTWSRTPDFRDEPITTHRVYFPMTRDDIRPAWSMVLPQKGIGHTYEILVDASTGQVLRRSNQLRFFGGSEPITMRVYTGDSPAPGSPGNATPNGFQFPFVARERVTIDGIDVAAWSPEGWIPDGGMETLGNNVDAHSDLDTNNSPDLPRPNGGPERVFDFALDTSQAPTTYTSAAITQLFYLCNVYHDRLYALGFDEAAGNFQSNNFGLGGVGGDRVLADAQDGAGVFCPGCANNANFNTTGSDGSIGRMQMYVFNGPAPDRDGDLDADIVFHEFTHGLSIRLHGGLSGQQPEGMGEGWSDFFGVCLSAQATDDPNAVYCTGGYATYQLSGLTDNYYFGIRRYPYSTDMNKSPLTYGDIDPAQLVFPPGIPVSPGIGFFISTEANSVHNMGEIWCQALLECRANLWATAGFAANELMMQLIVDGMKLSPANPNFLVARDAILQADMVNNAGANQPALWSGFAKRGLGFSATSPATSANGVVEAFDAITFSYPDGIPSQLLPGVPTIFGVEVTGIGLVTPLPGTGQIQYSVNGGAYTAADMPELSPNEYVAVIPPMPCLASVAYYVSVGTDAGLVNNPALAPAVTHEALVFSALTELASLDFETNPAWTVSTTASDGPWERALPIPLSTCDRGNPDGDGDGSGQCWVTDNSALNNCNSDVDSGATVLTSVNYDLTGLSDPQVEYARWYSNTGGPSGGTNPFMDILEIEVSSDGGNAWVDLETVGPALDSPNPEVDGGWFVKSFHIAEFVPITSQFRIRFTASDQGSGSVVEAGIDAFRIFEYVCESSCLRGDLNEDTFVDGRDISLFAAVAVNGGGTAQQICAGDVESTPDGVVDEGDITGFVECMLAGACP
jgi:hypothetical protein